MKETIKASIGGYAFIFDLDAYEILNSYLERLQSHFKTQVDGSEILEDIEARMSELLLMKTESSINNVSSGDANDIIKIMGNPIDFDEDYSADENSSNNHTDTEKKQIPTLGKRIYRDKNNSVLGGVFSGFGQYFRIDPVIIRIIYVAAIILCKYVSKNYVSNKLAGTLFILYFIFWAVMPKAKTMTQKLAMTGIDPSIEAIEIRNPKSNRMRGEKIVKAIGNGFRYFFGSIFILVSIALIVAIPVVLAFPYLPIQININHFDILNTILINRHSTILPFFVLLIPTSVLLYIGIKLLSKVTIRDISIICIALFVWISIILALFIKNPELIILYQNRKTTIENIISEY